MSAPSQQQQQQLSHQPIEEMMRNLIVEEHGHPSTAPSKDGTPSDATSCISACDATSSVKESEADHEFPIGDQGVPYHANDYYGHYYPGYGGSFGWPDGQVYYVAGDGSELQYPVMQADNGSLIYFMPGIPPAYNAYGPYLPVTMIGVDGQFAGQPPYPPSPVFQTSIPSPAYIPTPLPYGESIPSPYLWNPSVVAGDGANGNIYTRMLEIPGSKPQKSSPGHTCPAPSKNLLSDLSNSVDTKSPLPTSDASSGHVMRNQLKPGGKATQHVSTFQSDVLGKGYFPFAKFPSYNQGKGTMLCPNSQNDPIKSNVRTWSSTEKPKTRSKTNNLSDVGLPNEHNHGCGTPTIGSITFGGNAAGSLATDGKGNSISVTCVVRRDQYNLHDFPTKYDHAFFFVIKSYSEDDIHKCIKYNVWASTPNGNKRLDSAYVDAQQKMTETGSSCPVFLFFSVNASGQFCGVAEMIDRVDFNKNMDFWQQDKWNGCFPVKWHIIKDVPNPRLRHIILENNENKPVTNSRDTQEVRFPQGIEILNIFKNYISKTCILDDFAFYESRQKVMQEKRPRPFLSQLDYKQVKADELIAGFQPVDIADGKNVVVTGEEAAE